MTLPPGYIFILYLPLLYAFRIPVRLPGHKSGAHKEHSREHNASVKLSSP